jgi:two-component system LytT family sensor kinase
MIYAKRAQYPAKRKGLHFTLRKPPFAQRRTNSEGIPVFLANNYPNMGWIAGRHFHYLVFSLVFFIFWFLFKMGGMPVIPKALFSAAIDTTINVFALVCTVEILLPRLIYRKNYGLFFAAYAALIFLAGSAIILSQLRLLGSSLTAYHQNVARSQQHYFYWFWADLVFGSYFMVFFISAAGAAIRLAIDRVRALNKVETFQKVAALSELEILKNQINPHFLFNALNTIYYKIDRMNTEGRETLMRFSGMLRYQLYECDKPFVEVEKELAFIRSYIELQKERLNTNYRISCEGLEEIKGFVISPFLLLPLIENCFKHVSGHPDKENKIAIRCTREKGVFYLSAYNTAAGLPPPGSGGKGIGLENIKKRLRLIYPDRHELITSSTPGAFEVILKLEC